MNNLYFEGFIRYLETSIEDTEKPTKLPFEKEVENYYYKKILEVAKQFYYLAVDAKVEKSYNATNEVMEKLKEENEQLKKQIEKSKCDRIKTAHEIISGIISEKVYSTVRNNLSKHTRTALKREILEALKWKLQVRYANNFKDEHIEGAKEFIKNYKIDNFYLKEAD